MRALNSFTNTTLTNCGTFSGCSSCVENSDCWWCKNDKTCYNSLQSSPSLNCTGNAQLDEGDCEDDYTSITFYAGIAVLVVLVLLCCCIHWQYRRRKQKQQIEKTNAYIESANYERQKNLPWIYQQKDFVDKSKNNGKNGRNTGKNSLSGNSLSHVSHSNNGNYAVSNNYYNQNQGHMMYPGPNGTMITNNTQNYMINATTGNGGGGGAKVNVSVTNTFVRRPPAPAYVPPQQQPMQAVQMQSHGMQAMQGMQGGPQQGMQQMRMGQQGGVYPMVQGGVHGVNGVNGMQGVQGIQGGQQYNVQPPMENNIGMLNRGGNGGMGVNGMNEKLIDDNGPSEYNGFILNSGGSGGGRRMGEKSIALLSNDENNYDISPNAPIMSPNSAKRSVYQ